jgi:hypothetical protein
MASKIGKILVVDDNQGIRRALEILLPLHFAEVKTIPSPSTLFAVRKVFGSDVTHETWRNVRSYMILVGVACLVGIPLAIWAAQVYLQRFAYRVEGYGWVFVVAVLISLTIAFGTVLWQTLKAAKTNPAIELKKE